MGSEITIYPVSRRQRRF